jgi:cytoskeletal protein CcmA (bactofilin family)
MIRINGIQIKTSSKNSNQIIIGNNNIQSNGDIITISEDLFDHDINIEITEGSSLELDISSCNKCNVSGDVSGNVKTSQGDITIKGNVKGDVKTSMGNIDVEGSLSGNAKTSMGNVTVKNKN